MVQGVVVVVAVMGLQTSEANANRTNSMLYTRVRSTNRYIGALVREGYERSATVRELVHTIQGSNVTVWVEPGMCAGGRIRACLVSVSGSARARYIWIKIDPQHTIRDRLIAAIAHELQHAVEIAEEPDVTDASAVVSLYRRIAIGRCREGLSEECETERALEIEKIVNAQLVGR